MLHTKGRDSLVAFLKSGKLSQAALAAQLKVKQPSLLAWVRGIARPVDHYREALERITGIPRDSWRTESEHAIATGAPAESGPLPAESSGPHDTVREMPSVPPTGTDGAE